MPGRRHYSYVRRNDINIISTIIVRFSPVNCHDPLDKGNESRADRIPDPTCRVKPSMILAS